MAGDGTDTNDLTEGTHEPRECMACRGTGRVISNLGGTPSTVECPWCSGSGLRPAEIDAQAHWGEQAGEADAGSGAPPAEAASEAEPGAGEQAGEGEASPEQHGAAGQPAGTPGDPAPDAA